MGSAVLRDGIYSNQSTLVDFASDAFVPRNRFPSQFIRCAFIYSESNHLFNKIKEEYRRNSRIERFVNPTMSFPLEQAYVNLSIVETKEQRDKEKQLQKPSQATTVIGTYEEIYAVKTPIDVKDIFKTCKKREKQVLVFGRAGIGKSTFARYIAYQWASGSCWSEFELLALIPLRRLTSHRYPPSNSYSLIDLVRKEVFPSDLIQEEQQELEKKFDPKRTFWILDGYDEIVQSIPSHLESLLEQLLKTPHHIITSRPYLNTLSYDVQMEIIGFTDENIQNYIHTFFDHMKGELDDASVKEVRLLKFIKSNPSIWGVAHIPINLELICSLWSNVDWSETKGLTITRLYVLMTQWLCRRYLKAQGIDIQHMSANQVYQQCQEELSFIENLAFQAMKSNTILIRPDLLEKVSNKTGITPKKYPDILKMGILKSVNKPGIGTQVETDKDHYFVHHSFQEYFAARYLMNALQKSQDSESMECIRYHKYNQRYTLVFSFVAGLLGDNDTRSHVNLFLHTLSDSRIDLVGIRHMQLILTCMEEIQDKSALPLYSVLLEWIAKCLKYAFVARNKTIRDHMSQWLQRSQLVACDPTVQHVLIDLIQNGDSARKIEALLFIQNLKMPNPSVELIKAVMFRLDDQDGIIKKYACDALSEIGDKALTNEVISSLMRVFQDSSKEVRKCACDALGEIAQKLETNGVLNAVVSVLEDYDEQIRVCACYTLGEMGERAATTEVIHRLMHALEDQNEEVKNSAYIAIEKIAEKVPTNEMISELQYALGHESDWIRKCACEALGKMGRKLVGDEVIGNLVGALQDESEQVRAFACSALGNIVGGSAAADKMISEITHVLKDPSKLAREHACSALGEIGERAATKETISKLMDALVDQNEEVAESACVALGKLGSRADTEHVISKLVDTLGNQNPLVRKSACDVLGKMGVKAFADEVINALLDALEDGGQWVKEGAYIVFGKLGQKAAKQRVINKLICGLEDSSELIRVRACEVIEELGQQAATTKILRKLVGLLDDSSEEVRVRACYALEEMGEKAAMHEVISKLISAIADASEQVRRSAFEALGKIVGKTATAEWIDQLVRNLENQSEVVKEYVCDGLAEIGKNSKDDEVIIKLVTIVNSNRLKPEQSAEILKHISSSHITIKNVDPRIVKELCRTEHNALNCFKDVLETNLIKQLLETKDPNWLPVVTQLVLFKGIAIVPSESKLIVYGKAEPCELHIDGRDSCKPLIEALTKQAKQLQLFLEIERKKSSRSPLFHSVCNIL